MWRERLIGVLLFGLVATLAVAAFSHLIPESAPQYISVQARMLDSIRPHLLVPALALCAVLAGLGQRRAAAVGGAAAMLVLVALVVDHAARIAPRADQGDLSVVWFNMLETNEITAERLARALRAADADVIVIGESTAAIARDLPTQLGDSHPHRLGCTGEDRCGVLLLSRLPLGTSRIRDMPSGRERFIRVVIEQPGRQRTHLIAFHMVKPWFSGFAETEMTALEAALDAKTAPPTILVGDFNAAPWSWRMRHIERSFGLRHAARPIATWPAGAGALGVPIDHVLLRGGTALSSVKPWGADLGSNHRGLRAEIALPRE